jgi:endonuclease/exonuclease/phosphatase family metal-dependent hydrolase
MRIRVATLNVWALPPPFAEHVSERMAAIGRRIRELDADVVSLQEVWTPGAREALIAAGLAAGMRHSWHNEASLGGSGLLVLSRLPIDSSRFERYSLRGLPEEIGGDFYGGKGFVRVLIETPDGPIALLNTHLHARYAKRVRHEYRGLRTGQIVQLAIGTLELEIPVIATGDFNFNEHDSGHRVLTGLTGLRDVAAESDERQPTVCRQNAYRRGRSTPDKRIDYVFTRNGSVRRMQTRWIKRVFDEPLEINGSPASYSDHAGLLAELDVFPGTRSRPGRPNADAIALARALLAEGRNEARIRQQGARNWATAGALGALAATGARGLSTTRRRLLRGVLRGSALLALTPSVGLSILSEHFVSDELRAFDDLTAQLARVEVPATGSIA